MGVWSIYVMVVVADGRWNMAGPRMARFCATNLFGCACRVRTDLALAVRECACMLTGVGLGWLVCACTVESIRVEVVLSCLHG